jgi:quercetin dioxygenase-like cupin family protein
MSSSGCYGTLKSTMDFGQSGTESTVPDYTIKQIEDIEAVYGGVFRRARAALGVTSFGMQILELPPTAVSDEHDHSGSMQEEVYVVLDGDGEITVDGERQQLDPETLVRVGPLARRQVRAGSNGLRLLALGGTPGQVYQAPKNTELGAPDLHAALPHSRLMELLDDPEAPVRRTAEGSRIVQLAELEAFVADREGSYETLDERLDQFLTYLGGAPVSLEDGTTAFELPD